jgi:DNA-binding MarR family transcriptional regulator
MTNRIDQLSKDGLVKRIKNPSDGRGVAVSLTKAGFKAIDSVLVDHVATQNQLTSSLSQDEQNRLNILLRKFLTNLEKQ